MRPLPPSNPIRIRFPAAVLLAASALMLSHGPAHAAAAPDDSSRVRRWRQEIDFIAERIVELHPRPFTKASRAQFDSAARAIREGASERDDARNAVEAMRMVAMLQDGHTMLIATMFSEGGVMPLVLRPFEDGLYVTGGSAEQARNVGTRVVRIGDLPADEALEAVLSIASGDNRYTRLDRAPLWLMLPGLLHALGISPAPDRVTLELERSPGVRETVTIAGGPPPANFPGPFLETEPDLPPGWVSARSNGEPPRCDRRPDEAWWFEVLPPRTLYVRLRRIEPVSQDATYFEFYRRLFAVADSLRPTACVVDLRHDHGGNNSVVDPLVAGIVARPSLDALGSLFVLTDRGTFSAAMNAAVFLDDRTRATFVGEPTGGGVNHYGDARDGTTPHFGMRLQVSTIPWLSRYPMDSRPWIAPHIAVPSTFASWRGGKDVVLEAALAASGEGALHARMLAASRRGVDAAVAERDAWVAVHPNPWGDGSGPMVVQALFDLADSGRWAEAIPFGEAIVRSHPKSPNAWQLLGEAHLARANRSRARECFRRAVEVNPRSRSAAALLERVGNAQ